MTGRSRVIRAAIGAGIAATAVLAVPALAQAAPPPPNGANSANGAQTYGVHTATPYLGWSSWSLQAVHNSTLNPRGDYSWLTETNILTQAKALATTLKPVGYQYVNIDAGWWRTWDWTPEYDSHGRYAVDAARFPDGMRYTIARIHQLGLKVGLYVPVGLEMGAYEGGAARIAGAPQCTTADVVYPDLRTTNGWNSSYKIDMARPCAQSWLDAEAAQLASWGVDFLKIDGVGPGSGKSGANYDNRDEIAGWDHAFARAHRRVVIELSWALSPSYAADWSALADSRRIDNDVECYCSTITSWKGIAKRFTDVTAWLPYAGHDKGWNNLDSLDVGNGAADGLTNDERRTAASFWAIEAAPLYSGDDLTTLDAFGRSLLTNRRVIAIDQSGDPAVPVSTQSPQQVWWSRHRDGSYTVALFNLGSSTANVSVDWSQLGVRGPVRLRDVWSGRGLGVSRGEWTTSVPSHGVQLLSARPA